MKAMQITETSAMPTPAQQIKRQDEISFDRFDALCDHIM
jgi:hypothetical protein